MPFWFNVTTGKVETDETKSQGAHLMGPYESEAEASRALDTAHERTQKWDDEDREWNTKRA